MELDGDSAAFLSIASWPTQLYSSRRSVFYLHTDHLGSTLLTTDATEQVMNGNQPRYAAYGRGRTSNIAGLPTDYTFTGQRQDNTGLIYMNARYYDPETGQFISPDTLVPDATNVFDYNRYMYARGNPIRYNDPDGHCATLPSGSPDGNDSECWRYANTIVAQWDNTPDYWNNRFTSKDVFSQYVAANGSNHADFFHDTLTQYAQSDAYNAWAAQQSSQSGSQAELADPMCAGQGACQVAVQATNQVAEPVAAYCQGHDCAGIAIDSVGFISALGVAAVCTPGFAACATATAVGAGIGFGTGTLSVVRTGTLVAQGSNKATKADLVVSTATFLIGTVFPAAKLADRPGAMVGAGAAAAQMTWDIWGSEWWNSSK